MKKILFIAFLFLVSVNAQAQIPAGYYDNAAGKAGDELKLALHNIIKGHTVYPYTSSSTDVWDILKQTDKDPNNPNNVILIYTGRSVDAAQEYNNAAGWSREHVWAKSHGFPDETDYGYTDAHHLRPADISVNTDRGTKDFDNGGTPHSEATECNYDSDSWEPRDDVKGDIARMMFYMAVRYEGTGDANDNYDLELVDYTGTSGPLFGKLSTLLQWHKDDPVDDFERNRNEVIFGFQANRNPFIDHPEYASCIWESSCAGATLSFSSEPVTEATINVAYNYNITTAYAQQNATVAITCPTKPDWLTLTDNTDGTAKLSGTPANLGTHNIKLTATDGTTTTSQEFVITVEPEKIQILSDDFASCGNSFTTYSIASNQNWTCTGGLMEVNGYNADVASNDWLISKAMDLNLSVSEKLTFVAYNKYTDTGNYPAVKLKYSTDYSGTGSPSDATWTEITYNAPPANSQQWVGSGQIDLSGIAAGKVYIAFQYTSTGTGASSSSYWKIDDVLITGYSQTGASNQIPQITSSAVIRVTSGNTYTYNIMASDADQDNLTFSVNTAAAWLTLSDNGNGTATLTGTPSDADAGSVSVSITVSDGTDTYTQTFDITVSTTTNNAPTITSTAVTTAQVGSTYSYSITASDADADAVAFALNTAATWLQLTDNTNGTALLTGTPTNADVGTVSVVVMVADATDTHSQAFDITVGNSTNTPPQFTSQAPVTASVGEEYMYNITATDGEGNSLKFDFSDKPVWLFFYDNGDNTATLKGTPELNDVGQANVKIYVTDNISSPVYQEFSIAVSDPTDIQKIKDYRLKIYPNPIVNYFNLEMDLLGAQKVEIQIQDVQGKVVQQLMAKEIIAHYFSEKFNINAQLPNGLYFVAIQLNGHKINVPIMVKK